MKLFYKVIKFIIISFTISCTTIPKQYNSESSVIAIKIVKTGRFQPNPIKAFLISIDNSNNIISKDIIGSSENDGLLTRGDSIYFFNVKPGRYAAIAVQITGYAVVSPYGMSSTGEKFIIFSDQLITSTIVDVEPGTFAYMGGFLIKDIPYNETSDECDEIRRFYHNGELVTVTIKKMKCDETQKYYYNLFSSIDKSSNPFYFLFPKNYHCGSLQSEFVSKNDKIEFLKFQLKKFKGTQWENNIRRTLLSLESD